MGQALHARVPRLGVDLRRVAARREELGGRRDIRRVGRGRQDERNQRIRVERDRPQQLVKLLRGILRPGGLRLERDGDAQGGDEGEEGPSWGGVCTQ